MNDLLTVPLIEGVYYRHSTAIVDPGASVGTDTRIWHFAHVMGGAVIGKECSLGQNVFAASRSQIGNGVKIQNNVSLYDRVIIEDDVFLGPSMVFTNVTNPRSFINRKDEYRETRVKRGASIGANATILCGIVIGEYALIGAGAVVTRNVPDYALVTGVPARQTGWSCWCGHVLPETLECRSCGRIYQKKDDTLKEVIKNEK